METAIFKNFNDGKEAATAVANMMLGEFYSTHDKIHANAVAKVVNTLSWDGGVYGEPVYLRTTDTTPITQFTFAQAVDACAGELG